MFDKRWGFSSLERFDGPLGFIEPVAESAEPNGVAADDDKAVNWLTGGGVLHGRVFRYAVWIR